MSKRSGSSVPPSYYNEGVRELWPVLVFRCQGEKGWEVYDPGNDGEAATTPAKSRGKKGGDKYSGRDAEELTAAPRVGCIEVRKMRLRIKLFEQHKSWNHHEPPQRNGGSLGGETLPPEGRDDGSGAPMVSDEDGYDADAPGADGWNNNALVVRRGNTLLVSTRRGMQAVVLQFKSTRECLDFCDRLVYLNRDYFTPPSGNADGEDAPGKKRAWSADNDNGEGVVNTMVGKRDDMDEMKGFKRHRGDVVRGNDLSERKMLLAAQREEGGFWLNDDKPDVSEEVKQSEKQEQLMSYIVKLAHSEEFRGFVDEIERGLESAQDTAAIHAALGA